MISWAAWSRSSTDVDVELSQRFWAWLVRLSDSYSAVFTRSLSSPPAICSWSTPPSSDTTNRPSSIVVVTTRSWSDCRHRRAT